MMRILRKLSGRYKLLSIQVVRTTNNMPCVVVVEKLEHDLVHETLKHQLYDMSQYVNISPEMYVQSIFVFSSRGLYYFDTFNFRTDQIGQDVLESFWHSTHLRIYCFFSFIFVEYFDHDDQYELPLQFFAQVQRCPFGNDQRFRHGPRPKKHEKRRAKERKEGGWWWWQWYRYKTRKGWQCFLVQQYQ